MAKDPPPHGEVSKVDFEDCDKTPLFPSSMLAKFLTLIEDFGLELHEFPPLAQEGSHIMV